MAANCGSQCAPRTVPVCDFTVIQHFLHIPHAAVDEDAAVCSDVVCLDGADGPTRRAGTQQTPAFISSGTEPGSVISSDTFHGDVNRLILMH